MNLLLTLSCDFIDDQLYFVKYVRELCISAARQTNALRRIVKYLTPEYKLMYTAFSYCNIVPYFCGDTNSPKIEKVHKGHLMLLSNVFLEKV